MMRNKKVLVWITLSLAGIAAIYYVFKDSQETVIIIDDIEKEQIQESSNESSEISKQLAERIRNGEDNSKGGPNEDKKDSSSKELEMVAQRVKYAFEEITRDAVRVAFLNNKIVTFTTTTKEIDTGNTHKVVETIGVTKGLDSGIENMKKSTYMKIDDYGEGEKSESSSTHEVIIKGDKVLEVLKSSEGRNESKSKTVDFALKEELFDRHIRSTIDSINKTLDISVFMNYKEVDVLNIIENDNGYELKLKLSSATEKYIDVTMVVSEKMILEEILFDKKGIDNEINLMHIKVEKYVF